MAMKIYFAFQTLRAPNSNDLSPKAGLLRERNLCKKMNRIESTQNIDNYHPTRYISTFLSFLNIENTAFLSE